MKNSTISSYFSYRSVSIGSWLASVLFFANFSIAVSPQNDTDRALLLACKQLDAEGIEQALCLGGNPQVTDPQTEQCLNDIMRRNNETVIQRSDAVIDRVRGCEMALRSFPAKVLCFVKVDAGEMPDICFDTYLKLGCIDGVDYLNDTIIHRAIRGGEQCDHIVKKIMGLRGWFNWYPNGINTRNKDGDTPLHLVMKQSEEKRSSESRRKMCLFLVSRGANAGIKNNDGVTPITYDNGFWLQLLSSGKPEKSLFTKCKELLCRQRSE